MKYFYIEPEVAGGLGKNTIMNHNTHPPIVSKLHYQFDGWLGDVILESFPCFIVTEEAKGKLESVNATGIRFAEVEVTTSEQFQDLYPNHKLPKFVWLQIEGKAGDDDFGIDKEKRLVISGRVLKILKGIGVSHALITCDLPN